MAHRLQVWLIPIQGKLFRGHAFMLVEGDRCGKRTPFRARKSWQRSPRRTGRPRPSAMPASKRCRGCSSWLQAWFDIEQPESGRNPISDRLRDHLDRDPLFCGNAEITLFGRASSSRNLCVPQPYPGHPHRLTPFLCWGSQEHDITYQIYAALKHFKTSGRV